MKSPCWKQQGLFSYKSQRPAMAYIYPFYKSLLFPIINIMLNSIFNKEGDGLDLPLRYIRFI